MSIQKLKSYIKEAPKKPGVYLFKSPSGKPLYIGKAVNIRSRLLNYPRTADSRIREMIRQAGMVIFRTTDSDIEALILESQLIKKHRPDFNIVMRDDKQYFYVIFSGDKFQRITLSHQPSPELTHIGPFTDGAPLKDALRLLRRLFPYCTCKQRHHVRCLNAHIGKCLGFCCLKKDTATKLEISAYKKNIEAIRQILSGKKIFLLGQLRAEMKKTAKSGKLEEAIKIRKQIANLERVFENATIIRKMTTGAEVINQLEQVLGVVKNAISEARGKQRGGVLNGTTTRSRGPATKEMTEFNHTSHRIEGYDIANIQGQHATGSMVVFTDGVADKNEYRKFNIKTVTQSNDVAMLKEILTRRLKHADPAIPAGARWPLPDLIIVDGGIAQLNAARSVISKSEILISKKIPIIALTKDAYHKGHHIYISDKKNPVDLKKLPEPVRNLILNVDSEAHRFAISHYRHLHRQILRK